jgi:hypothetical protein
MVLRSALNRFHFRSAVPIPNERRLGLMKRCFRLRQSGTNGSFCEIEFVLRAQIKNLGNFPLAREYRLETAW